MLCLPVLAYDRFGRRCVILRTCFVISNGALTGPHRVGYRSVGHPSVGQFGYDLAAVYSRQPQAFDSSSFDVKYRFVRCQANKCDDRFYSFDSRSISSDSQLRHSFGVDISVVVCHALRSLWQTQAQPEETTCATPLKCHTRTISATAS